jgi:hypothetical protein
MLVRLILAASAASLLLAGCGSYPDYGYPPAYGGYTGPAGAPATAPAPARTRLPNRTTVPAPVQRPNVSPAIPGLLSDRVTYSQKDKRWGQDRLGKGGGTLAREGCVVTSAAMAMTNSGYPIDPGELNRRLTDSNNLTHSGLLKWKGISEVSGGRVKATFHSNVSDPLIQGCLAQGDYPLVRFFLPNGRSHWAMVLGHGERGYWMRDPLRVSDEPLLFPRDSRAFKSLRCIGPA